MEEKRYSIISGDNPNEIIAQHMTLETALLVIRAFAETYWAEHLHLSIKEEFKEIIK